MEKIKSFDLSICRLLQKYPLYNYRTLTENGLALSVLFIGSGAHMDTLRGKILSHGQLLDTELTATIITEHKGEADIMQKNAPDLHRFFDIHDSDTPAEWTCGTLWFKTKPISTKLSQIIAAHRRCKYVLVSTETDDAPPPNLNLVPDQLVVWVAGDSIHVCGTDEVFHPERDDESMKEILDIAYRLHYAYAKGNDPHITNQEIWEGFNDPDQYNYQSNIESALHIRSKLKCAGIDPTALNSAAEDFAKKLAGDAQTGGELLDRLSQLEHRRWCVSKVLGGRRKPDSLDVIYGSDGSTTHSIQPSGNWHVALVPYLLDDQHRRHLSDQDWIADDPEAITDLDELDKQTLRIHRHCARISREKLELSLDHIRKLKSELPEDLGNHINQMEEALKQMLDGSRDAVFLYRYHRRKLESNSLTDAAKAILKDLSQDMGAPIEYLTRKDYKKQNLTQIGSIPFALCGWKSTVLVKLMAETVQECVAAAWQLEPGQLVFVDTAESLDELKQLRNNAQIIDRFLRQNCNQVSSSYHVFVPRDTVCIPDLAAGGEPSPIFLQEILSQDPSFFKDSMVSLYPTTSLEPEDLRPRFVDLMYECGATSIDMTGSKPALISLADGYARNNRAGAFYVRDNRIRNFYGARGMELQALDKGLSVQALFDQAGAKLIKRDDENISVTFYNQYQKLWEIAHRHTRYWHYFCISTARAYSDKRSRSGPNARLQIHKDALDKHLNAHFPVGSESKVLRAEFEPILQELLDAGLLTYDEAGKLYRISCEEVLSCLQNSGKILEYYLYCTAMNSGKFQSVVMSWEFSHNDRSNAAKNEVDVICSNNDCTLFISAKNTSISTLKQDNYLNYVCYEVGWLADRFGGSSHKTILAAPNVPQFEKGKRSKLVQRAMSRGVYLLGDICFQGDNLATVLDRIIQGKENWCEDLPTAPALTGV